MTYFNTNNEVGPVLEESRKNTEEQEKIILNFFRDNAENVYSPDMIWANLFSSPVPLTSIRRAITNLTNEGYLEKTTVMVMGSYGKRCHTWILKKG